MSWVYWGILVGFFALVVTLLVSFDICYGAPHEPEGGASGYPSGDGENAGASSKHAA